MTDRAAESPIATIVGERVTLGPLSKDIVPTFTHWMNDFNVQKRLGFGQPGPITAEEEENWYESMRTGSDRVTFVIRERESMRAIGTTGLHAFHRSNQSAMFGIAILDPDARGKGFGTESTRLMLDYGFTVLGLHSISLTVAAFNKAGQRAYARAGFRENGRLRERLRFAGEWWDEVYMDCLASEFQSPVLARILVPDE